MNIYKNNSNNTSFEVVINKTTTLEELIDATFKNNAEEIFKYYNLLSTSYDAECLHQLRVSLRKFKSFLSFIKNKLPSDEWEKANNIYKYLIKPTSKVRDFDVVKTEHVHPAFNNNKNIDDFNKLYIAFKNEQNKLHINIENVITSDQYTKIINDLLDWINNKHWKKNSFISDNIKGDKLKEYINEKAQHKYKKIINKKNSTSNFSQKELHKLRINVKELRYILEILGFYIKHSKKERNILKNLQEVLGKINDTYVTEKIVHNVSKSSHHHKAKIYISQQARYKRNRKLIQLKNIV